MQTYHPQTWDHLFSIKFHYYNQVERSFSCWAVSNTFKVFFQSFFSSSFNCRLALTHMWSDTSTEMPLSFAGPLTRKWSRNSGPLHYSHHMRLRLSWIQVELQLNQTEPTNQRPRTRCPLTKVWSPGAWMCLLTNVPPAGTLQTLQQNQLWWKIWQYHSLQMQHICIFLTKFWHQLQETS